MRIRKLFNLYECRTGLVLFSKLLIFLKLYFDLNSKDHSKMSDSFLEFVILIYSNVNFYNFRISS